MRMRRHAALLMTMMILAGCEENWGEKIKKFVDGEVHGLSVKSAQAELRVRWFDFFNGLPIKAALNAETANGMHAFVLSKTPPVSTFAEREALLTKIGTMEFLTIDASGLIETTINELADASGICDTSAPLHQLNVESIGQRIASQIAIPNTNWFIGAECESTGQNSNSTTEGKNNMNCLKGYIDTAIRLFDSSQQAEQEKIARQAVDAIPAKVVSAKEVEALSRAICIAARDHPDLAANRSKAFDALQRARATAHAAATALQTIRAQLDVKQFPTRLHNIYDTSGMARQVGEIIQEQQRVYVQDEIDRNRKDIAQFEKAVNGATLCGPYLAAAQDYRDVMGEKQRQLEASLAISGEHIDQVKTFLSTVKTGQMAFEAASTARVAALCKP